MTTAAATPEPATKRRVQAYPAITSLDALRDFLARAAWHFAHVPEIDLFVPLAPGLAIPADLDIPDGFAPQVQAALDVYLPRVRFQVDQSPERARTLLQRADIVLKCVEGDAAVNEAVAAAKKTTFRVDPAKVRQEGSFFIQCAFDLYAAKAAAIADSRRKFDALLQRIGQRETAWVMATGPSVEAYAEHDYSNAAVIVCNSVVLNDELMQRCKPAVLVFADPIFHFGVSQYAGRFREVVEHRLATTDLTIVVPFKYYALLVSKMPRYADRIIGVPFEKTARFNFDIREKFQVKTTANILTLLLLPLATTLARQVNLIGCDGRPLEEDNYFWGHGKSVQINDKMENIQRVHPGFFAIDYNEYYFEHCHTLDNLVRQGESAGWRFAHQGPSHIPALRDRPAASLALPFEQARAEAALRSQGQASACLVLEPDGVGMSGHYVRWHRNLIGQLDQQFDRIDVLCNRKQDPALYPCPARPTYTSFSWGISRADYSFRKDFADNVNFKRFVDETLEAIRALHDPLPKHLSLYVYYGSVQILKAVQLVRKELLRQGTDLKAFVCLFHESVILDANRTEPRFPPNAAEILLEGAAQVDNYRIACVTERLCALVFDKYGVASTAYPNPTPDRSDAESAAVLKQLLDAPPRDNAKGVATVLFPTNPREEKGAQIIRDLLDHLRQDGVPAGQRYVLRGAAPAGSVAIPGVEFLGDDVSDEAYWHNLRAADAVVIPYPAPSFTFRTSGIMVDALVSAVPSIVMNGTWLADVVNRAGAGLAVDYRSAYTLVSAANVVLANRDAIRARMAEGTSHYLSENSWVATAQLAMK